MIRHVVFDLDGTLIDSKPDIILHLREAVTLCGYTLELDQTPQIGPPLDHVLEVLLPHLSHEERQRVKVQFMKLYDASTYRGTRVFAGFDETLRTLKQRGMTLHIATNKRLYPTQRLVQMFFPQVFAHIYSPDVIVGKTLSKSEMLRQIMATSGHPDPTTVCMVGDTYPDVEAARNVGADAVAVTWGYAGSPEEFRPYAPLKVADHPKDLLNLISFGK